jgi:hypothetical protein
VVLVTGAHLLPALVRDAQWRVRATGCLLWVACLATTCYGHTIFFVLAQEHAGERRASTVISADSEQAGRSLTAAMSERAAVTRQLAFAQAQRCVRDCGLLDARRTTLAAKLDALEAEHDDIRRRQSQDDRVNAQRDALRADPVTSRLAALLGTTTARVDLLSGLAFAAVLEGVACLLWTVVLRSAYSTEPVVDVTRMTQPAVAAVTSVDAPSSLGTEAVTGSYGRPDDPVPPLPVTNAADDVVTQLAREIAAGRVRATVVDIRRHLGCSQARAVALRRQLASLNTTA